MRRVAGAVRQGVRWLVLRHLGFWPILTLSFLCGMCGLFTWTYWQGQARGAIIVGEKYDQAYRSGHFVGTQNGVQQMCEENVKRGYMLKIYWDSMSQFIGYEWTETFVGFLMKRSMHQSAPKELRIPDFKERRPDEMAKRGQ